MHNHPDPNDVWAGIGGHHDAFSQILCEFIDNSISNLVANSSPNRTLNIKLEEVSTTHVEVTAEDQGTGIKNLEAAFRLGDRSSRESPLNEHGFGLKHALASANPTNDAWAVLTRTANDFKKNQYKRIAAPYTFDLADTTVHNAVEPWPGTFNGSGTLIQFRCSIEMYNTLRMGIQGAAGFRKCVDYLAQDLGYIYAGMIKNGIISIVIDIPSAGERLAVPAIEPTWKGPYPPGESSTNLDLGGGVVKVEYHFGEMGEGSTPPSQRYYKRNIETSGVEIRFNGRLIMSNLFSEVWDLTPHPLYNHLLVAINLVTDDIGRLPRTRTSKNGVRSGDEKLRKLFDWIRSVHPKPETKLSRNVGEADLVEKLREAKQIHIPDPKHVEKNYQVFSHIGGEVKADLYVSNGQDIYLYEAKKDYADVQDLYQLLMYWDGAVADGLKPTEGYLLAADFSPAVATVIAWLNGQTDAKGNLYKFSTKTWKNEGIPYPP